MNKSEAMQHGLGYAAGREDVSSIPTVSDNEAPGFLRFAEKYAEGWDEYNTEKRGYMTNCRSGYDAWQASQGKSIFSERETAPEAVPETEAE